MSLEHNDKITWVGIGDLKPHPKNPNKHPDDQIERLAQILTYQGFRAPIVVSNRSGFIVAGHGRLEAAKKMGLTKVPVSYQDFTDEEQEYAHMTADNAIASWASLDFKQINLDLQDIGPFDIDLLGIKDFTIDIAERHEINEIEKEEKEKKVFVEIECSSEEEGAALYEELLGRGLIVRVK